MATLGILFGLIGFEILKANGQVSVWNISSSLDVTQRYKRSSTNHVPHCINCDDSIDGKCSKKTMTRIQRFTEQIKCLPEPTLIKLHSPGPQYTINPTFTRVKRCNGHCRHGFHACIPEQVALVKVPILLFNHQTRMPKCVHYEVMEHEKCGCDCEIPLERCSQRHRHENCQCQCNNENDKYICLDDLQKIWDEEKCECVGCEEQLCEDGWIWNAPQCRCVLIAPPSEIENNLYK